MTLRRRQISNEAPLPRGVALWNDPELTKVGMRWGCFGPNEPAEGYFLSDILRHNLRVRPGRWTISSDWVKGCASVKSHPKAMLNALEDICRELGVLVPQ